MYENNSAVIRIGNVVSTWFGIKSGVKQGCVLSPFVWIILMKIGLRSKEKTMGEHGIKWRSKIFLDLKFPMTLGSEKSIKWTASLI